MLTIVREKKRIGITLSDDKPNNTKTKPVMRFVTSVYGARNFPTIPMPAPISTNINTNPHVNKMLVFNILTLFPFSNPSMERFVKYIRYSGTSGNKQDAKKVVTPAKKAIA